jgi:hypothetical protein
VFAWGFSRRSLATEEELVPESAATVPTEIPDLSLLVELEPHLEPVSEVEVLPVATRSDPLDFLGWGNLFPSAYPWGGVVC